MSSEQRIRCRRAFGITIPKFAVGERWVTGLTTATRCLRSARRPVEGLAQRAFSAGQFQKTLAPSGYPISFIIETKPTIKRRLIHTLHSVGRIIPRFGIAIRPRRGDGRCRECSAVKDCPGLLRPPEYPPDVQKLLTCCLLGGRRCRRG
jgi:hypothetical protein